MRMMLLLFALLAGCIGQSKSAPKDARPAAGCPTK
jgi:hypothetical protein